MQKIILILLFIYLNTISYSQSSEEYFRTLRNDKVNLRQGPSFEYPIKIIYKKKFLPILIQDSFDNFRKVRDHENNTGWIHISQLSKKKAAIVIPSINNKKSLLKDEKKILEVRNIIGATFLSDKKKFTELGMFDEDFFFYWEDMELSNRINKSNYQMFLNKRSKAIHKNSKSSVDSLKIDIIRNKNFIFGEMLYDYKVKKIRKLKIIRKLLQNLFFLFFNIFSFKLKASVISLAKISGILLFLKFYIKKIINI